MILDRAWQFNRLLIAAVVLMVVLVPLPFPGMIVNLKIITGVNGWIKPLKFLLSSAIYGATFLWLLTYVNGRQRIVQIAAYVTGIVLLIEVGLIVLQVLRGHASHFNTESDLTV